jgi:cytochrome c peroxidase
MRGVRHGVVGVLCLAACGDWHSDADGFTELDRALFAQMELKTPRHDDTNPWLNDPKAQRFGQELFFDKEFASSGRIACTDCHSPNVWFSDVRSPNNVSKGVLITTRNAPALVNVAFYETFGWDGRADTIWGQVVHAYESPRVMGGSAPRLLAALQPRYATRYQEVVGTPLPVLPVDGSVTPEMMVAYRNLLQIWAAYLTQLNSADAPFDRFARGENDALTLEQRRGLKLFIGKAGCIECHSGPSFTDNKYHSVGVGQLGDLVPASDLGRYTGLQELAKLKYRPTGASTPPTPTDADKGQFRTKGLRQVAETGPYFHAGQLATLEEVVWFYNRGGDHQGAGVTSPFLVPLGLTDAEQADLVSFLRSLTGAPIPAALRCDPSLPSFHDVDGGMVAWPREFEACP